MSAAKTKQMAVNSLQSVCIFLRVFPALVGNCNNKDFFLIRTRYRRKTTADVALSRPTGPNALPDLPCLRTAS